MSDPLGPTYFIPSVGFGKRYVGNYLSVCNSRVNIFSTSLDIVDDFPVMLVAGDTLSRSVDEMEMILSYLRERYRADVFNNVFVEPFAESIVKSVYEYTVNAETGEVLESRPGIVAVGDNHSLYICVSEGDCIVTVYDSALSGGACAYVFCDALSKRMVQLVSALDVGVFPDFTEEYFEKIIREKFVPFFKSELEESAYEVMVKSLCKEYDFSCKKEDEFTICERVMDVHYVEDSNGNKVPVLKVMAIKIKNPDSKDVDYWIRRDTSI